MVGKVEIIYDDKWLTVVNKPHGLQSEPDRMGHPDLVTITKSILKKCRNPVRFLQPVNRLDRPTSGLVLLAKSPSVLKELNLMQEERLIKKEYLALLEGQLMGKQGVWEHFLLKEAVHKRAVISESALPGYKPCLLEWRVTARGAQSTLVRISLKTGRYHQIRAQSAFMGHPVWGDEYYGSKHHLGGSIILLKAVRLEFMHPRKGERLMANAPGTFSAI